MGNGFETSCVFPLRQLTLNFYKKKITMNMHSKTLIGAICI